MIEELKSVFALPLSRISRPIVVNSFGRSGSTVLTDAIVDSALRVPGLGRQRVRANAWDLRTSRLMKHRCYKTHDYPPNTIEGDPLIVYVFGDPVDAAVSVMDKAASAGPEWFAEHCDHLRVKPFNASDLATRDALRVAEHLEAWLSVDHADIAFIRYESMWDHEAELTSFLGFTIKLPRRRPRLSNTDEATAGALRKTYGTAIELVASLPDWMQKDRSIGGTAR